MIRKYFVCLLAALLLLATLAVPVFAEPEEEETTTRGYVIPNENEIFDSESLTDEETTETPPVLTYAAVPETTLGIVPIDDVLPPADEGLLSQRNLTFGALGLGGLALLLSVVALARTRRKTAPNATGNYQKYF